MGERYAVLISGDLAETGFYEFWYDVVLMREALLRQGFADNHIFILYGKGADFYDADRPYRRYCPHPAKTDYAARSIRAVRHFETLLRCNRYDFTRLNRGNYVTSQRSRGTESQRAFCGLTTP